MNKGGLISAVEQFGPAYNAGLRPGCVLNTVNDYELRDIIDWRWYADDNEVEIGYTDTEGNEQHVVLSREFGQDWGIEFSELLFDGVKQCRNNCIFCFMQQLPDYSRDSLRFRDDDFRLSFLQGNFVTFTNIDEDEEQRILEQYISPLRFSLHAISPDVRARLIGPHAAHGLDVAQRLLAAGIEMHVQIVLLPGVNDGDELTKTLSWCYEQSHVAGVGIVPMGFTKHQTKFDGSFNDPERSRSFLETIEPFQKRALDERGWAWVNAADEFYCNAYPDNVLDALPLASYYGDFDMFDDGIGMVRTFVDDFASCSNVQKALHEACHRTHTHFVIVSGEAQKAFLSALLAASPVADCVEALYVKNNYFGGNVSVTGLLCACDLISAMNSHINETGKPCTFVIPKVVFNADGLTLDGMMLSDIQSAVTAPVHVVSCQASEYFSEMAQIAHEVGEALDG